MNAGRPCGERDERACRPISQEQRLKRALVVKAARVLLHAAAEEPAPPRPRSCSESTPAQTAARRSAGPTAAHSWARHRASLRQRRVPSCVGVKGWPHKKSVRPKKLLPCAHCESVDCELGPEPECGPSAEHPAPLEAWKTLKARRSAPRSTRLLVLLRVFRRARRIRLFPTHIDQHRSHLADGQRDFERDLPERFGLASRPRVFPQLPEQAFQPLNLCIVLLLRLAQLIPISCLQRSAFPGCLHGTAPPLHSQTAPPSIA